MDGNQEIINRVQSSGLIVLDLEELFPIPDFVELDIRGWLFEEILLKEKDFREKLKQNNWEPYTNKHVAIFCSSDALLPKWTFLLLSQSLNGIAASVHFGNKQQAIQDYLLVKINEFNSELYRDAKVIIKGCSSEYYSESAYVAFGQKLIPFVSSLMYGEPCSTVPIYKRKN